MTAVRLPVARESQGRSVMRNGDDGDPFDRAVALILGPRMPGDDPERRRSEALALAAAALRAAGEKPGEASARA